MFRRRNPLCADPFGFHAAAGRIVVVEQVDHIVPRAAGGTDEWSNLQSLCARCHARKTARYDGGFGNTDCGTLPIAAIDFERAVIEYDRPKTAVRRAMPLWPETVDAIRSILTGSRPTPVGADADGLVFLTETGRPLVRQRQHRDDQGQLTKATYIDRLRDQFIAVLNKLGLKRPGIGFYTLRHTFRTWADEARDQHAIHRIMGHAIPGMSGIYIEDIELDRLRAVVDHVHTKLPPEAT